MAILERHSAPDGLMTLILESSNSDLSVGFEGYSWHTHGDLLEAWGYQGSPELRARTFINDILESRRAIAIVRTDGKISDICVPDDLIERPLSKHFNKYAPANETTEFRYWNGIAVVE